MVVLKLSTYWKGALAATGYGFGVANLTEAQNTHLLNEMFWFFFTMTSFILLLLILADVQKNRANLLKIKAPSMAINTKRSLKSKPTSSIINHAIPNAINALTKGWLKILKNFPVTFRSWKKAFSPLMSRRYEASGRDYKKLSRSYDCCLRINGTGRSFTPVGAKLMLFMRTASLHGNNHELLSHPHADSKFRIGGV